MIRLERFLKKNPLIKNVLSQTIITANDIAKVFVNKNNNNDIPLQDKILDLKEQLEGKKICVIGNSPILNTSGLGDEIDSHDAIFRCNLGIIPNICNPIDIGNKTTHFVTGTAMAVSLNTRIYSILKKQTEIRSIAFANSDKIIQVKIAKMLLGDTAQFIYDYDQLFQQKNIGIYPSTGTRILDLLVHNIPFQHLTIYGFSFNGDNRISGSTITNHQRDNEKKYILNLIKKKDNINLIE